MEAMEKAGTLVPIADFEMVLAEHARQVIMVLDTLPDVLERDAGISPAAVERCQQVIDGLRQELSERLAKVADQRKAAEAEGGPRRQ
ncbi:MAG: DUF1441 family protein [Gammaproteobacteria bacterium]|nr:DUF1441 family protein [Gammaproteobacteria bacterium]